MATVPGTISVLHEIATERQRQVEAEGWSPEHDDEHTAGELCKAAMAYCQAGSLARDDTSVLQARPPSYWPFAPSWWKPKTRRRDLIRAATLIVAEIERLDRADPPPPAA